MMPTQMPHQVKFRNPRIGMCQNLKLKRREKTHLIQRKKKITERKKKKKKKRAQKM